MSGWQPTCMTAAEHQDWREAAEWANLSAGVYVPPVCADCTHSFRRAAKRDGTCNQQGQQDVRERVLELRADGLTWGQIASRMGHGSDAKPAKWAQDRARDRSKSTAREDALRRRAGLRIYRSRAELDGLANQILAMREDGLTFDAIDRALGLTPHYAQQIAVRKRSKAA